MKALSKNLLLISLSVIYISLFLDSCKQKGCTNKAALNYNSVADEDDGTCILCKTTQTLYGNRTYDYYDFNHGAYAARFYFTQIRTSQNDQTCGGDNSTTISMKIQSLINQGIRFTIQKVYIGNVGYVVNNNLYEDIPAFQTTNDSIVLKYINTFSSFSITSSSTTNITLSPIVYY